MRHVTPMFFASLMGLAFAVGAGHARAEDGFDLKVTPGHILVTPKEGWHINLKYPWRLTMGENGETKIDKSKFELSEAAAAVSAPKGSGKLKGAVCQGENQCRMFEQAVSVP